MDYMYDRPWYRSPLPCDKTHTFLEPKILQLTILIQKYTYSTVIFNYSIVGIHDYKTG